MDIIEERFGKSCLAKAVVAVSLLGLAYGCFVVLTGYSVPCPVRYFTGFRCPGCGTTTLMVRLVHGDVEGAIRANAFVFYTGPLLFLLCCSDLFTDDGRMVAVVEKFLLPLYAVSLVLFGIFRNFWSYG